MDVTPVPHVLEDSSVPVHNRPSSAHISSKSTLKRQESDFRRQKSEMRANASVSIVSSAESSDAIAVPGRDMTWIPTFTSRKGFVPSHKEEQDLFRGVRVSRLLQRGGALLYLNGEEKVVSYDAFEASHTTSRVDYFLSHSWRTKGILKVICLKYLFHLSPAFWCGMVVGLVFTLLDSFGYFAKSPHLVIHVAAGDECQHVYMGLWWCPAALVGIFVFWFGYLAHPLCDVFFDRCCINQTDVEAKLKGINMLSQVLLFSSKFVVMWTPEYFDRLWCCAEMSTYVRYRGIRSIIFLPLDMPVFVLSLTLFHLIASIGFCIVGPVTVLHKVVCESIISTTDDNVAVQQVISYSLSWVLLVGIYAIASPFLVLFMDRNISNCKVLKEQLASFSVLKAKCTCVEDVAVVNAQVCNMFGTLEACDHYIQTHMMRNIELLHILLSQGCRYKDLMFASFGHWFLLLSAVSNADDGEDKLHLLCAFCFLIFCGDALSMWLIGRLVNRMAVSPFEFCHRHHLKIGSFLVTLIFTTINSITMMFISRSIPLAAKGPFVACSVILTWCLYDVIRWPRRCSRRHRIVSADVS